MSNQKSIIGCGYIPRKAQAVCLKTNAITRLGEVEYKIIKDPYERTFKSEKIPWEIVPRSWNCMAVNVLDANTGLTYAVEYEPANLVCPTSESKTDQPGEPVDFATRVGQIAEELKAMFDPAGGGEFRTNAVLHSLRFRMTGTIKHRRASGFSAVEVVGCRRLLLRRVPRTPKSSKS